MTHRGPFQPPPFCDSVQPVFYRGLAGSQVTLSSMVNQTRVMLEEQARHLLNEQERATMGYYLDEYKEGNISVDALVMALFELLNTHAKVRPPPRLGMVSCTRWAGQSRCHSVARCLQGCLRRVKGEGVKAKSRCRTLWGIQAGVQWQRSF